METFVYKNKRRLRCGYTTGTCAALAAKGAACLLLTGGLPELLSIMTPKGIEIAVRPQYPKAGVRPDGSRYARCAVRKDAGDDPDVTDGLYIFAEVSLAEDAAGSEPNSRVLIEGGEGVGRVTKGGLNQPVGSAAINDIPRKMIAAAVLEIAEECGEERPLMVTISAPGGVCIAGKTFNPVLGITGGISILGTSGIVEPMSEEALVETIRAEMNVLAAEGRRYLVAVFGGMGADSLRDLTGEPPPPTVKCSNFIGKTIDLAGELGFRGLLIAGHLGKLVKLGNGIMNTHSSEGDGRLDTLISCALSAGAGLELLREIQSSNTTEEALDRIEEAGKLPEAMEILMKRIGSHISRRAGAGLSVEAAAFSGTRGFLGGTPGAEEILKSVLQDYGRIGRRL